MKALLFLIFIIIITTSCHDNKKVVDLSRTAECNINLNVINLEDSPLYPKGCCLIDSFLVLFDYKNDEGFISVYKDTLLYARYGKIGSGPNEFINPTFISNGKCLSYSDGIKIGDVKSIYNLSLDSIIKPSIKNNLHETIVPEDLRLYNYVLQDTDSFLVVNQTRDKQLTFYRKSDNTIFFKNYFDKIPSIEASDFNYTMQIYDGFYTSNSKTMMIAYKNRKRIDLISSSGELMKSIYFPNYDFNDDKIHFEKNNVKYNDGSIWFFTFVAVFDEYYYALCWDDTKDNIRNGKAKTKIYQIDANGNIIKIINLNKSVSYFCIDKYHIYAIGISEDNLDLQVYHANISDIF